MKRKKILCVFGTRPEAIKMAPVVAALRFARPQLEIVVCVTAQHRKMLDDVLEIFDIRPQYDLNIMQEGQSLEYITKHVIEGVAPVLKKEKPDLVLVHGDTSTTFLTALACFYQRIPVGHVEAGLRTYDFDHPFPEEGNRRLCDDLCALHFAPTGAAKENLLRENIARAGIFVTGNTVIDALRWAVSKPHKFQNPTLRAFVESRRMTGPENKIILVTAHRRENFGKPLERICKALRRVVSSFSNISVIYPVHPNPNVCSVAHRILAGQERIVLIEPLNYLDFSHLLKMSTIVVTDSGGLQEEAPSLGKPVLVLREVTERPEAVESGTVKVVGTDDKKIVREIARLLTDKNLYRQMAASVNPYGDGSASARVVQSILHYFGFKRRPKAFHPR